MKHYPSWRYHKSGDAKIIKSEAEDLALDKGWKNSPADHAEVEEKLPEGGGEKQPEDFDKMTVKDLVELLKARGSQELELKGKKKADLVELCKGAA